MPGPGEDCWKSKWRIPAAFWRRVNLRHHPNRADQPAGTSFWWSSRTAPRSAPPWRCTAVCGVTVKGPTIILLPGSGEKPSPLGETFDRDYFNGLILPGEENLSLKAFLATHQRIPGLGNGVLQDILYRSGLHPKENWKVEYDRSGNAVPDDKIGPCGNGTGRRRDIERDLFDQPGGYRTG